MALNPYPLVSVCILHHNRFDELKNSLRKIKKSNYSNLEIIIVDNCSKNFDEAELHRIMSGLKIIKLTKNIGIAGWNKAFNLAKGEILLTLDDDSYPDAEAIKLAVEVFGNNKDLHIIAAKVVNESRGIIETAGFNEKPDLFVGCGAFIKRIVFDKIGYFNEQIFIYLHELDFCARAYDAGFNIIYKPEIIIYHTQSDKRIYWKNKNPFLSSFRYYHYFISYSIFLLQRFRYGFALAYLPKWILNRFLVAAVYGYWREFFRANRFLLFNIRKILLCRKVLGKVIQKFYRNGNVALLDQDYFKKNER